MLKDWIFVDQSSGYAGSDVKLREAIGSKTCGFVACTYSHDAEFFASQLAKLNASCEMKNYVVLTSCPEEYTKTFISNNIVDTRNVEFEDLVKRIKWVFSGFGREKTLNDRTWFISDTHFGHTNIIRYCNRPWNSGKNEAGEIVVTPEDTARMDADMISRWNSVVEKDDDVYHLGDFLFGKDRVQRLGEYVSKLNGRIHLILGNHDRLDDKKCPMSAYYDAGFYRVHETSIVLNKYFILSHAPMEFLNANTPFVNLFGHVHDSDMYKTFSKNSACLCVERHDYTPVSFTTIMQGLMEANGMTPDDL